MTDEYLSNEKIEEILNQDASALPPEAHLAVKPLEVSTREVNQHRLARWAIWLILLFLVLSAWQVGWG